MFTLMDTHYKKITSLGLKHILMWVHTNIFYVGAYYVLFIVLTMKKLTANNIRNFSHLYISFSIFLELKRNMFH